MIMKWIILLTLIPILSHGQDGLEVFAAKQWISLDSIIQIDTVREDLQWCCNPMLPTGHGHTYTSTLFIKQGQEYIPTSPHADVGLGWNQYSTPIDSLKVITKRLVKEGNSLLLLRVNNIYMVDSALLNASLIGSSKETYHYTRVVKMLKQFGTDSSNQKNELLKTFKTVSINNPYSINKGIIIFDKRHSFDTIRHYLLYWDPNYQPPPPAVQIDLPIIRHLSSLPITPDFDCGSVTRSYRKNGQLKKEVFDDWNGRLKHIKYRGKRKSVKIKYNGIVRSAVPPCGLLLFPNLILDDKDKP